MIHFIISNVIIPATPSPIHSLRLAPVDVGWARPSVELQTHALQDELKVYYQCGGGQMIAKFVQLTLVTMVYDT